MLRKMHPLDALIAAKFPFNLQMHFTANLKIVLQPPTQSKCFFATEAPQTPTETSSEAKWQPPKGVCLPAILQHFAQNLQAVHAQIFGVPNTPTSPDAEVIYDASHPSAAVDLRFPFAIRDFSNKAFWVSTGFWKTSHKNMSLVANQLKNLTIDDAIAQMTFSRRSQSVYVHEALQHAKQAAMQRGWAMERVRIVGACVGRGSYTKSLNYRAKGRCDVMRHPSAHARFMVREVRPKQRVSAGKVLREDAVSIGRKMDYYFHA